MCSCICYCVSMHALLLLLFSTMVLCFCRALIVVAVQLGWRDNPLTDKKCRAWVGTCGLLKEKRCWISLHRLSIFSSPIRSLLLLVSCHSAPLETLSSFEIWGIHFYILSNCISAYTVDNKRCVSSSYSPFVLYWLYYIAYVLVVL